MKILFITDSLGFCRDTPEKLAYNETYINILKKKYLNFEIIHLGIGGGTVSDLLRQSDYYLPVEPNIIFIQTGIVDCAPRSLSKFEIELINRIPFFSTYLSIFIRKNSSRLRNFRSITYTPKNKFENDLEEFIEKFNTENIFSVGIMPASKEYEAKISGITEKVIAYNKIIQNKFEDRFLNCNDFTPEYIMTDHHHLNKKGHLKLSNKLIDIIEKLA